MHRLQRSTREWPNADLQVLHDHYPSGGAPVVQRLLPHRTRSAIYSMAHALKLVTASGEARRANKGQLSLADVAAGLGVTHRTVLAWIRAHGLRAKLQGGEWRITPAALRKWLRPNQDRINLGRVNKSWFLALVLPAQKPKR